MESYAKKMIPLQRWGTPADIANMVAFLASPGRRVDHGRDPGRRRRRVAGEAPTR